MQISTFFLPMVDVGSAQEELNSFLRGHRVLQVEKAFAGDGWAILVEWLEGKEPAADWRQKRVDYREKLPPEQFERFAKLRERRKAIAVEAGVPPYMVMTDAQMAESAKFETLTISDLKKIEGFGEARIEKYGLKLIEKESDNGT